MRRSLTAAVVLHVLLQDPPAWRYGTELTAATGVRSGTIYPLLRRLAEQELLMSRLEQIDPRAEGRPPRRYYRLTPAGEQYAREILSDLSVRLSPGWLP